MDIPTEAFRSALRGVLEELRTFSHALLIDDQWLRSSARYATSHHIHAADAIHLAILLALQATAGPVVMNDDASQPINGSFAPLVPKGSRS